MNLTRSGKSLRTKPTVTFEPRKVSKINEWWSPKKELFFTDVYYRGDHSIEGWLEDQYLSVEQRIHREVSGVKEILSLTKKDSILDVPCGWGKHSLSLAARGFKVTGLDLNHHFLNLARSRRRAMGFLNIPRFVSGDMRNLPLAYSKRFTIVLNLVLSFGFFDEAGNEQTLNEFSRVLKKGGRCLIHTDINPARVLNGSYEDRSWQTLMDGAELIVSEEFDQSSKHLNGHWTIVNSSGKTIKRYYSLRIYTNEEVKIILRKAGMELLEIYGSLDEKALPYSEDSQEVVYVARKI